tara:strand:- start:180 stop:323 length:144 start_codon:yes stop_codon:yes gene_type:complete
MAANLVAIFFAWLKGKSAVFEAEFPIIAPVSKAFGCTSAPDYPYPVS